MTDCVLAKYDAATGKCRMKLNTASTGEEGETDQCPLGKFNQGHLDPGAWRADWDHLILGPCFEPKE